jgi:SulP family sulfate permease
VPQVFVPTKSFLPVIVASMWGASRFPKLPGVPIIVMAGTLISAVFSLIDYKSMEHAWRVHRTDGIVGLVTFVTTLIMTPKLADGVLVGVA